MKFAIGVFVLFAVGCGGSDEDAGANADAGGVGTGVSCEVHDNRICCERDVGAKPTCVAGEWRCPEAYPSFIPSSQCVYPVYVDTGVDTACDPASDACESCPTGTALECPGGCTRYTILKYDETKGCLYPTESAICFPPDPHDKCLGVVSCRRNAAGELFRIASSCMMSEYDFCAGAEDTKVLSASVCDAG